MITVIIPNTLNAINISRQNLDSFNENFIFSILELQSFLHLVQRQSVVNAEEET